jgi:hypothetical protein
MRGGVRGDQQYQWGLAGGVCSSPSGVVTGLPRRCGALPAQRTIGQNSEWYNNGMELVARPARDGLLTYWVRSLAEELVPVKRLRDSETYAPTVVVVSSSGEEWVLQRPGTYRQAQAACRRFEGERQSIGDVAFCRAHGVPGRLAELPVLASTFTDRRVNTPA